MRLPLRVACIVISVTVGLILLSYVLSGMSFTISYRARTERGFIETTTSFLWCCAIVVYMLSAPKERRWWNYCCIFVMLTLLARELDLHSLFTDQHITSTRYWRSPDIPFMEKLLVAGIVLPLIINFCLFVKFSARRFISDLKGKEPYTFPLLAMVAYAAASLFLDDVVDVERLKSRLQMFLSLTEESLEMGIPVMIILSIIQSKRQRSFSDRP